MMFLIIATKLRGKNNSNAALILCICKNAVNRSLSQDILSALLTDFEPILVSETTPNKI
jgi:hypothetical protein